LTASCIVRVAGLSLWLASAVVTAADINLTAPVTTAELSADPRDLGSVIVPGIGPVRIVAERQATTVTVFATAAEGRLVGQAESVVGVRETPIAVQAPDGLQMITVRWPRP
jgi:hypothetical protein